jgi:hypothetical protein
MVERVTMNRNLDHDKQAVGPLSRDLHQQWKRVTWQLTNKFRHPSNAASKHLHLKEEMYRPGHASLRWHPQPESRGKVKDDVEAIEKSAPHLIGGKK